MSTDYSSDEFKKFVDALPDLHLIADATARNLRSTSLLLLSTIYENQYSDVRDINVDSLINDYLEMADAEPSESSIQTYKSRFNSAIAKFVDFQEGNINSLSLPSDGSDDNVSQHAAEPAKKRIRRSSVNLTEKLEKKKTLPLTEKTIEKSFDVFSAPMLLRPQTGLSIEIKGLPLDLTNEEAERIASFLKIYVRP
ncbi:hypothetical protein [Pantoea sp.]|uniref:hypothetical protein n=1 Tax=Pantoea sp. TaxID=69393 RepID=UPI0031D97FC1